jgi:hypothetical protein
MKIIVDNQIIAVDAIVKVTYDPDRAPLRFLIHLLDGKFINVEREWYSYQDLSYETAREQVKQMHDKLMKVWEPQSRFEDITVGTPFK